MKKRFFLILTFIVPFLIQAQEALDLRQCIDIAQENNLQLKVQTINERRARIDEKLARMSRLPNLNMNASLGRNFGFAIDPTTNTFSNVSTDFLNSGLNANARLFRFGQINNDIRNAELGRESARQDLIQMEREIALQVSNAFLQIALQQELLNNAQRNLDITQQQLERTEKLFESGAAAEADQLNLEAQLASDQQTVVEAQNAYDLSLLNLRQLMLYEGELQLQLPDSEGAIEDEYTTVKLETIADRAMAWDARIKSAELRAEAQSFSLQATEKDRLPSLDLFGNANTRYSSNFRTSDGIQLVETSAQVNIDGEPAIITQETFQPVFKDASFSEQLNNNLGQALGLSLNIPIYNRNQLSAAIEQEELTLEQRKIELEQARQQVQLEVAQAWQDYRAGKSRFAAAETSLRARELAEKNARRALELGAMNAFDYTQNRLLLDNAISNFLQAKYNYLFSIKVLDYYTGKPL
jgi:outer membrane protein